MMASYLAMLRGINVSGQKIIKMDALKTMFSSMGYTDIVTYIQSGNVWFNTEQTAPMQLKTRIEDKLMSTFGFDVTTVIRDLEELEETIRSCPYTADVNSEEGKLYVSFLTEEPSAEAMQLLSTYRSEVDDYQVQGREVYIRCRGNYGKSLFSNTFLENKLKVRATTRNWNSVHKLAELGRKR